MPKRRSKRIGDAEFVLGQFWKQVNKLGPVHSILKTKCWSWLGSRCGNYGDFSYYYQDDYAHRFSWELYNGKIPEGMLVCHHCDNPLCVNPKHLFLGTKTTNADMVNKGRHGWVIHPESKPVGEYNGRAILNESWVRLIRDLARQGMGAVSIKQSTACPACVAAINNVIFRKSWRHVK